MKIYSFRLIIFVTVSIPCYVACSRINSPSNFLSSFSLIETIKRMNVQGTEVTPGSTTASVGDLSPFRHDFDLEVIIEESMADRFDEDGFLSRLKEEITREVNNSCVKVNGSGSGNNNFNIDYHTGKHHGWVEVIGARTEKNKYRVWCIIREIVPDDAGKN
ncbi:MAG TPA: hypothetical protein VE262_19090 [Blastocatellia bacterium]|nr:hypothetical protein [Blastocatellia bacterium]